MFGLVVGVFCGCLLWLYDSFGLFCIVILHCCCLVFGFLLFDGFGCGWGGWFVLLVIFGFVLVLGVGGFVGFGGLVVGGFCGLFVGLCYCFAEWVWWF